jgi:hypothetical protein
MRRVQQSLRGWRPPAVMRCVAVAVAGMTLACGDGTGPIGMVDSNDFDGDVPRFELRRGDLGWEVVRDSSAGGPR